MSRRAIISSVRNLARFIVNARILGIALSQVLEPSVLLITLIDGILNVVGLDAGFNALRLQLSSLAC